jgi:hypothetical protein
VDFLLHEVFSIGGAAKRKEEGDEASLGQNSNSLRTTRSHSKVDVVGRIKKICPALDAISKE